MSNSHPSKRFAVAVSFPGEHRKFVKNVVERLAEVLGRERVFYDEWYQAELLGLDGDIKLRRYYREQSDLVVPFFSEHYRKDWCQIEWSAIRSMLKQCRSEDAVIPVEMDGTRVEGWEDIDFAICKKQRTGKEIAERGPMPLYLADIHLTRARLFRDRAALTQAATLIRQLGYGRRSQELADTEAALNMS